jgi:hypothetical protein
MLVFSTSSCLQSTSRVSHICIGNSAPQDSRFYQHSCWSYVRVKEKYPLWTAWPWRWRHCNPSRLWELVTQWHSVTSQLVTQWHSVTSQLVTQWHSVTSQLVTQWQCHITTCHPVTQCHITTCHPVTVSHHNLSPSDTVSHHNLSPSDTVSHHNLSPSDTVSHHRILKSSAVPLLEPQILYVYIWWMCCFKVSLIGHKLKILSKVAEMALLVLLDRCPVSGLAEAPSLLSWGLCATFNFHPSPVQFIIHQSSFHLMLYTLVLFVGIPSLHLEL